MYIFNLFATFMNLYCRNWAVALEAFSQVTLGKCVKWVGKMVFRKNYIFKMSSCFNANRFCLTQTLNNCDRQKEYSTEWQN